MLCKKETPVFGLLLLLQIKNIIDLVIKQIVNGSLVLKTR
jgi:hypothetical protein